MRGRPIENVKRKTKYVLQFNDVIYHFDDKKNKNGAYLEEIIDPEFDKINKPKYHENGRKKRTTKANKIAIENTEKKYWQEHYRLFPKDKPKKRGRKPKR